MSVLEWIFAVIVTGFALQDLIGWLYTIMTNIDKFKIGWERGLKFKIIQMSLELVVDVAVIYICIRFLLLI